MNLKLTSLKSTLNELIYNISPEIINIRHYLHQHPELGRQEWKTTAYLIKTLKPLNLKLNTQTDHTGIWADLVSKPGQPFLALRSDMDALPLFVTNSNASS